MAYVLTGVFIQRKFFPKRPARLAGSLRAPSGAWSILPILFRFFKTAFPGIRSTSSNGSITNIFSVKTDADRMAHVAFSIASCGDGPALFQVVF